MKPEYLSRNAEFYARFWHEHRAYSTRFPNGEESARAGGIVRFMGTIVERKLESWNHVPPRILDLGSGRGWLTELLCLFGDCEGLEPAPEAVKLARSLFPNRTFHEGTIDQHVAAEGFRPVQIVVTSEVLEHIPPRYRTEYVAGIRAALVPGGDCIVTTPRGEVKRFCEDDNDQLLEEWLTEREVADLFRAGGFRVVEMERAVATRRTLGARNFSRALRLLSAGGAEPHLPVLQHAFDFESSLYQLWWFEKQ